MRSSRPGSGYEDAALDALSFLVPAPDPRAQVAREDDPLDRAAAYAFWGPRPRPAVRRQLPHIFRFRAVPGMGGSPRALVPDEPGAEYKELVAPRSLPVTPRARAQAALLAAVPSTMVDVSGRKLTIATRSVAAPMQYIRTHFPTAEVGCGLRVGAPRGRTVAQVFVDGKRCGIAKFADTRTAARLDNEADVLSRLTDLPLRNQVPELLGRPPYHLGSALLTTVLTGQLAPMTFSSEAADFLGRCAGDVRRPAVATELVGRVVEMSRTVPHLRRRVDAALAQLQHTDVPRTVVHGDFVPWNMRIRGGRAHVYDWEYGVLDGLPEWDRGYFAVQVGVLKSGWGPQHVALTLGRLISAGTPHYTPHEHRGVLALMLVDLACRYEGKRIERRADVFAEAADLLLT